MRTSQRLWVLVCALCLFLVALLMAPGRISPEPAPWHAEFRKNYFEAVYAKVGIHVYKIGHTSRGISSLFGYLHNTGHADERYYFVRCGVQDPLLLSPKNPQDLATLQGVRFSKNGDPNFTRFEAFYREKCWSQLYFQYKSITDWWKTL